MNMAGHNAVRVNNHSFVPDAVVQTVGNNPKVQFSDKNIDPVYGCKGNEVHCFLIMHFVFPAHHYKFILFKPEVRK